MFFAILGVAVVCLSGAMSQCTSRYSDTNNDYNLLRKLTETQTAMVQILANRGQMLTSFEETLSSQESGLHTHDERITTLEEITTNYTKALEFALTEQRQMVAVLQGNVVVMGREHEREIAKFDDELAGLRQALASVREELSGLKRPSSVPMHDCTDLLREGHTASGVYEIYLSRARTHVQVYCDMETDGGGWLVFQRREDGSVDFYRDWDSYKTGFGNESAEFWIGNNMLQDITSRRNYQLRIDLEDFQGETRHAVYSNFAVASESDKFRLTLGSYRGNADDSMSGCSKLSFSTKDRDNDLSDGGHCAKVYKGGWWYGDCHDANLNGLYLGGPHSTYADGIEWYTWHGYYYSLKRVEMKLRPYPAPR